MLIYVSLRRMKKHLSLVILIIGIYFNGNAQHKYYRELNDSLLRQFSADTFGVKIKETDPLFKYKHYFNYILSFYPKLEYKTINVQSVKSKKQASISSKGMAALTAPEQREYSLKISTKLPSHLDTVTFENLSIDARLGLISKQIGMLDVYSKSGFFEIIGLYFKKRRANKELLKDVNLSVIEAGLGYQLADYTNEMLDKLLIDYWHDKKAYKKYYNKNTKHLMSSDAIRTYMSDYPVYLQNAYK